MTINGFHEHRWKPGQTGNPNGRPAKQVITRRYPKTGSAKKKISAVYKARTLDLSVEEGAKLVGEAIGSPYSAKAFRSLLLYYFGTSAWPLPIAAQKLTKQASERLDILRKLSDEGAPKEDAMRAIGVGEVAFNRFLHRYFGAVVWPIGGEPSYNGPHSRRDEAQKAQQATMVVPVELTDEILAKYIGRKVAEGIPLKSVISTLDNIQSGWTALVSLCAEVTGYE